MHMKEGSINKDRAEYFIIVKKKYFLNSAVVCSTFILTSGLVALFE